MQSIENLLFTSTGLTWIGKILVSLFVVLLTFLLTKGISGILHRLLKKKALGLGDKKSKTVVSVLSNTIRVALSFIGLTIVLDLFGVNTASLIATAGVGGIAIGFGAQSLVKDVISGGFLIFEDQFSLGDYIKIGSLDGTVIETGLRVTKLKAFNGEIHIIPNGNITAVTNVSRAPSRALVEVKIPDGVDLEEAVQLLTESLAEYEKEAGFFTEAPKVLGLTGNMEFSSVLTLIGYAEPMKQWEAERAIRLLAYRVMSKLEKKEKENA